MRVKLSVHYGIIIIPYKSRFTLGSQATKLIRSVNTNYLFCKLRANTSLSVFIIPVLAESQAEIYIPTIFSTAIPSLYQPTETSNNFILNTVNVISNIQISSRSHCMNYIVNRMIYYVNRVI